MRLLLDEMHAVTVADGLAAEAWDVLAVSGVDELRGMSDADLLAHAAANDRALVTENIGDFAALANAWAADGRSHAGLLFTNPYRFNRATVAYPSNLIAALRSFLSDPPTWGPSMQWWLA